MITINDNIERKNTEYISMYHALWYAVVTVVDSYNYQANYNKRILAEILSYLLGPERITIFSPWESK